MTDDDITLALVTHALNAAAGMDDPSSPAARDYLSSVLTAEPAAVRAKLENSATAG